jgi:hypothetical protein
MADNHSNLMSETSIDSIPEIAKDKQHMFKYIYIALTVANSIIGYYLLSYKDYYLLTKYSPIIFFIEIYTYIWPVSMLLSIVAYIIIYFVYWLLVQLNKLGRRQEFDFSNILNVLYFIFVFVLSALYIFALPLGIYYCSVISHHESFKDKQKFFLIYVFLVANMIIGMLLICIIVYVIFCVRFRISRKQRLNINDRELNNIISEVKHAMANSGISNS